MLEQRGTRERFTAIGLTAVIAAGVGGVAVWSMSGDEAPSQQEVVVTENRIENGLVTEVFEDCSEWRVLETGKIVFKDEITCDGGSFIVVEGQRIQTSSGFTVAEEAFGVDISEINPGDRIDIRFTSNEIGKTMDCDACAVTVASE